MPNKTEEYLALACKTADSFSRQWEGRISDHSGTAVQIQLPGLADDLCPKTGCYGLCRV